MRTQQSRFNEEQIIRLLREQESGLTVVDLCHRHAIGKATFFKLKARLGGMVVCDGRKLEQLEDENAKLKRLLADSMLDNLMLKDINLKNRNARWRSVGLPHSGL